MAGTRIKIANALEDLRQEEFDSVIALLKERRNDEHTPSRFRQGQLYGKNHQGVADLLVDSFAVNAVPITVALLKAIGSNRVAADLEEEAKDLLAPKSKSSAGATAAPAMTGRASGATEGHFVDRNRNKLIDRVSNVESILDRLLLEKVLGDEQYAEARAISTTQGKMRFLFNGPLKSAGDRGKDVLLSALEEHELYLIKDLNGE